MIGGNHFKLFFGALFLIVLQVTVFDTINLFRWATPIIYPLLLIGLPMNMSPYSLVIYGFIVGGVIDYLDFTPGLHTSSMSLVAFARYYLLRFHTDAQDDMEQYPLPTIIKRRWYLFYAELLFIHHCTLFLFSLPTYSDWGYISIRFISSYILSYVISLLFVWSFIFGSKSTSYGK